MHRFCLTTAALFLLFTATATADDKKIIQTEEPFGMTPDGENVRLITLANAKGMKVKIITYGGIVTELHVPDKNGKFSDVVLGFDDLKSYLAGHPFFGANAGRVANRIAGGKFTLDGKEYTLAKNNGPNALHGGEKGFDKKHWKIEQHITGQGGVGSKLSYLSNDGEEGYPGNLQTYVTYTLTDNNALRIDFEATTDKATPVNLAHHSYFNLGGHDSGSILDHELMIAADKYTPTDKTLIPTGELADVKGTPLDFTEPTTIGKRIKQIDADPVGYDHNFVLRGGKAKEPRLIARVKDPKSGRVMEVLSTEPGVQLYTGNFLSGKDKGKGGAVYNQYQAFCLEAQHFPDSVNKPNFPSVILRPGQTYKQTTIYQFKAE
jgi:aldose 1-epimerase